MIPATWFEEARERIRPHVLRTPLTRDSGRGMFLKWENHQVTGSFKARGAINKVLALEPWERESGLVAASAGNHGQGVALAAQITGSRAEIFVPAHAAQTKVDAIRKLGGQVQVVRGGYGETESAAKSYATQQHKVFVSPYNDGHVIAGQGTVALEVLEQLPEHIGTAAPDVKTWIVPISGGGLICGCAAALASKGVRALFVGVQAAASPFTYELFHHGTQEGAVDKETLADGLSGAIDDDSVTIPLMREFVDNVVTVSELEIEQAIAFAWWQYGEKLEGSAAAALAAALKSAATGTPCVVVLSGGNVQGEIFDAIVAKYPQETTR